VNAKPIAVTATSSYAIPAPGCHEMLLLDPPLNISTAPSIVNAR